MMHERWAWMSVTCAAITASALVSPACGLDAEGNDAATSATGAGAATSTGTSAGASGPGSGGAGASSSSVGGSGGVPAGSGGMPASGGSVAEGGGGASSSSAGGNGGVGGGIPECVAPQVLCESGCADLQSDQANCGTCGAHCTGGSMCIDGKCDDCNGIACDTGESCTSDTCSCEFTQCQGNCVNTDYDNDHCGGCMTTCAGICSGGDCL